MAISRCFADGRGGYSARFIHAWHVQRLSVTNCVILNKMSGAMVIRRSPGFRMAHSVSGRPMISSLYLFNRADEPAAMNRNIFTDMLRKKAKHNIGLFYGRCPPMQENCFFVRQFPPSERHLWGESTAADLADRIRDPVFADPKFAGDPSPDAAGFPPDRMMHPSLDLHFGSFFATNPKLVEAGIGLRPAAFDGFHFSSQ